MELLGSYSGSLRQQYYQQLLALLNDAISAGDLSEGSAFDKTSVLALEAQAQSFASLPTGTAGSRVTDESLNYPLSLLQARLSSLQGEADSFTSVSGRLLDVMGHETVLLDDILAGDALSQWESSLPQMLGAWTYGWDFSIGQGPKSEDLVNIDPSNLVVYNQELPTAAVFDCTAKELHAGLRAPQVVRPFIVKDASWSYQTLGTPQELFAPDMTWAQLDLLEDLPRVNFSPTPSVQVVFPKGTSSIYEVLEFVGVVPGGALPTYVRILFYPRRNQVLTVPVTQSVPGIYDAIRLSAYNIDPNSVVALNSKRSYLYTLDVDFHTSPKGTMTPVDVPLTTEVDGVVSPTTLDIYFTEYWPAYQCSTDQANWSNVFMLDTNRPYRDDEKEYLPISIKSGRFPVTDETGVPTGIYFRPLALLSKQYTILVTTPPIGPYGSSVALELDIEQPSFMNTVSLSPYGAFPVILQQVQVEGLTSDTLIPVFNGSFLMEGDVHLRFPRQIVSKIHLTMVQQSYTIKEYQVDSPDALRRNTMNSLQSSLPFSMRGAPPAVPIIYRGYQYEFGFESLLALDVQASVPGVFVQGPISVPGCPDAIRVDAQVSGTVSIYLCYRAYDASGTLVDENLQGLEVTLGMAVVFPFASLLDRATVASTAISLRFVLRTTDAVVSRYYLQTTLR